MIRRFQMAGMLLLLGCGRVFCADVELISLPDPLKTRDHNYPRDVAELSLACEIEHIPAEGEAAIPKNDLFPMIDADRASGYSLPPRSELRFLVSLHALYRVSMVTLSSLHGENSTVTVQLSSELFSPMEGQWTTVLQDVRLKDPACSFRFRPTSAAHALVTFKTQSDGSGPSPSIYDFSIFTQEDMREVMLQENPHRRFQRIEDYIQSKPPDTGELFERQPNLGNMTAGSRISHISSSAKPGQANNMNDDDVSTYCEFDPSGGESVVVMDLRESRRVRKVSVVHSQASGEMDAYLVNKLPWDEEKEEKTAQLAWLDPLAHPGQTLMLSDADPVIHLAKATSSSAIQILTIKSSWFDGLTKFGSSHTDSLNFTQMMSPVTEARYLILRFIPGGGGSPFRIYDINVSGDYPPDWFAWAPADYKEESNALLTPSVPWTPPPSPPKPLSPTSP